MAKTFKEEVYEAAIKASVMPIHQDYSFEETLIIGGVTIEGKLLVITGKKVNDGETKIVVTDLGSAINPNPEDFTDEKIIQLGTLIAEKFREE